ncbi:aldehyde dehydrogenase family protein [Brochothrix campestris]|uniref:Acetaldehyde dehydrogenase n=1 Tax=Brochothrix campestris FSL F6-1037 TaxID=1265861 RepID=W7CBF6_9LIST|nr:aldehyde dehydrogenase family protein [Brochothrix campestris]EUJ36709.1 acetaldehyde dehydrogenase [Brochothrix campestris FSL F6-1037]
MIKTTANQTVTQLLSNAKEAQAIYRTFTQEQVDKIVQTVSVQLSAVAAELAEVAHLETGFGNIADKIIKNKFAAEAVYSSIKAVATVGEIARDEKAKTIDIAIPMGIIAGLIPSTNPTSTVIYKALIALKTRNAMIFSPHPKALQAIIKATHYVERAAVSAGAPAGLIQVISEPSIAATTELMRAPETALILATGGEAMVKAAYQSGTPAIGVGQGNAPAYIEQSANVTTAVATIIRSKTFDYGTICASEQSIVVDKAIKSAVLTELQKQGAYILTRSQAHQLARFIMKETGGMNPAFVGQPVATIARLSGLTIPVGTKVLVSEERIETIGKNAYSCEKLMPVLGMYTVNSWEEGVATCNALLGNEGAGHTAILHSTNEAYILDFGLQIDASRILINTFGSLGAIGASTSLLPSLTLGCGAVGGSSTTDNVSVMNLLNIKRLAYGQ